MSFTGAASTVVATLFRLLSSAGKTLMEFTNVTGTDYGDGAQLVFRDNNDSRDPFIQWSSIGTDKYLVVKGPDLDANVIGPTWENFLLFQEINSGGSQSESIQMVTRPFFANNGANFFMTSAVSNTASITLNITGWVGNEPNLIINEDGVGSLRLGTEKLKLNLRQAWLTIDSGRVQLGTATVMTTTDQVVSTLSRNLLAGDRVILKGQIDFNCTVAGGATDVATGAFYVNGTTLIANAGNAVLRYATTNRATVPCDAVYDVTVDGLYTFSLQASKNTAAGTVTAIQSNTGFTYQIVSSK